MHAPRLPRHALLITALLFTICAPAARAGLSDEDLATRRAEIVKLEQTAASMATEAPSEHAHPAPAPQPEELPRMTNKAAAMWGMAFMLTVCVAFSVFAGYAIYRTHKRKA